MNFQAHSQTPALKQCRSGILALRSGLVFPAVKQMRVALESLQRELDSSPSSNEVLQEVTYPDIIAIPFDPVLVANEKQSSPNNDFCFCLRAFDLTRDDCNDKDMIASILMYNFALAMHLYGLSTGNTRHLKRALVLYSKTKTLVEAKHQDIRYAHLALALWTNLGHVSSHFLIQEGIEVCRDNIRMILWHSPRNMLSECDLAFFSEVLLSDLASHCKNAAAA